MTKAGLYDGIEGRLRIASDRLAQDRFNRGGIVILSIEEDVGIEESSISIVLIRLLPGFKGTEKIIIGPVIAQKIKTAALLPNAQRGSC